jgi:uncharacterized protein YdhG (YjbR/CyaY superfamily)
MADAVDAYIATFPSATRAALEAIRRTIASALPEAEEFFSYKMPAYRMNGNYVIYFAGYAKHVSLYPVHGAPPALADALGPYLSGKATAKFPLDKPVPLELVSAIACQLAKANAERTAKKGRTKP